MKFMNLLQIILLALPVLSTPYSKRVACPDGVNTATNAACCPFYALRDDLQDNLFFNECSFNACQSVRLAFHDAIGFSESGEFEGGGADGSILIFSSSELLADANQNVIDDVNSLLPFLKAHPDVSAGDLVQFSALVGLSNCAGSPQVPFLAGRPNATAPASNGTIPEPQDPVDSILARFADAGFSPTEVVSLLAAHSIARQQTPGVLALDTTPFTFDTQFFLEILLKGVGFSNIPGSDDVGDATVPLPNAGLMRLQSDFALARAPQTACAWQQNINNQNLMASNFSSAFAKLALVGQQESKLIDCSEVVPVASPAPQKPATFPAGTTANDVQQVCPQPFPVLKTDPGPATAVPQCPNGDPNPLNCP